MNYGGFEPRDGLVSASSAVFTRPHSSGPGEEMSAAMATVHFTVTKRGRR
jgi:hypothetical protein